ncbi:hypothetical protein SAMN05892877_13224 [Rhizobium subbaraonis]|uniref:Uncharacterized protein n=1 Tax=Rhizobium subbaraonis TaxID=908946 RepID=A0A285V0U6_9HYPH|nr:hypothetical protein [Rhizobium subbaraonis]SOC47680.1 hypothetical protein SAMN05892877_13224 [Rhizobium subbaraonis]
MTSHLAHATRRGLMGPGHVRNLEAALGKRAGALTAAEKGQARANVDADVLGGFRNKIINGNFDVWQRGSSGFVGSNAFNADRWLCQRTAAVAVSRINASPGTLAVPGNPSFGVLVNCTVASTVDNAPLMQRIEDVKTLSGMLATWTFYAQFPAGKELIPRVTQSFGTSGSTTVIVDLPAIVGTGEWKRYDIVTEIPSVTGKTMGAAGNDFVQLSLVEKAPYSAFQFRTMRHSLVAGDASRELDPYSPRHLAQELAICQRYFERIARTYYSVGFARVTTGIESVLTFTRKRATPAVSASDAATFRVFRQGAGGFQYNAGTSLALGAGGLDAIRFGLGITDTTNIVAADAAIIVDAGAGASYVDIDAEL